MFKNKAVGIFANIPVFLKDSEGQVLLASVEENILSCFARSLLFNFFSFFGNQREPGRKRSFYEFWRDFFQKSHKISSNTAKKISFDTFL